MLSHSDLMEEFKVSDMYSSPYGTPIMSHAAGKTTLAKKNRVWRPEYNWLTRKLEDFDRFTMTARGIRGVPPISSDDLPSSRACKAVDRYVDDNFSTADKFLGWLGKGNYLERYANKYRQLVPNVDFRNGCNGGINDLKIISETTELALNFDGLVCVCVCMCRLCAKTCQATVSLPKLEMLYGKTTSLTDLLDERLKIYLKKFPHGDKVSFQEFAEVFKNPENRVAEWVN